MFGVLVAATGRTPAAGRTPGAAERRLRPWPTYTSNGAADKDGEPGGWVGAGLSHTQQAEARITSDLVMVARDADVIKTYVELGLGVGIIADKAFSPARPWAAVDRGFTPFW